MCSCFVVFYINGLSVACFLGKPCLEMADIFFTITLLPKLRIGRCVFHTITATWNDH